MPYCMSCGTTVWGSSPNHHNWLIIIPNEFFSSKEHSIIRRETPLQLLPASIFKATIRKLKTLTSAPACQETPSSPPALYPARSCQIYMPRIAQVPRMTRSKERRSRRWRKAWTPGSGTRIRLNGWIQGRTTHSIIHMYSWQSEMRL